MPLKIIRRKDRAGVLTIQGRVAGLRIRRRAQSNSVALAREEAAAIEAEILRSAWHGARPGTRTLAEAIVSYLEAQPRTEATKWRLRRIRDTIGDVPLGTIDQDTATRLKHEMLRPSAGPAAYTREVIVPLRALLLHAHKRGWCGAPQFIVPRQPEGRTMFLCPDEVERLFEASAAHIRPLLIFLVGTGARMSEALKLEWRDVDLASGRVIFWRTKNGKRRVCQVPLRGLVSLAGLPHREGTVFRRNDGAPYTNAEWPSGGQIKTAWRGAIRRAGINPDLTPHDLRHTWATWHYAVHKDLLALRDAGGWSKVELVERYAHLMPAGYEDQIRHLLDTASISPCKIA